jgi:iron complex outermembrane receptor protein
MLSRTRHSRGFPILAFVLPLIVSPVLPFLGAQTSETESADPASPLELDAMVVTASRFEEEPLKAPASVTILHAGRIAGEGVPAVVSALRSVVGVDVQRAGVSRYLVAVRGFNDSLYSTPYVMVDFRAAHIPALGAVNHVSVPANMLDIERVEIVRGPVSALYGPGVEHGIIHYLTKDPFTYPGTSLAVGVGEHSMRALDFRHAKVLGEKLAYKITGAFTSAEDWKLDPEDAHDQAILADIATGLRDIDGNIVGPLEGRDYDNYTRVLSGQLEYRFDEEARLIADVSYEATKRVISASLGDIQVNGTTQASAQLRFERGPLWAQFYGTTRFVDGDMFWYRTGNLMYDRSSEYTVQAQYRLEPWGEDEPIVIGADYRYTIPRTRGTINGRFEDADNFSTLGGCVQLNKALTDHLDFQVAGRVDSNDVDDRTVFSPRLAFVYRPRPEHTFRLTYNRASGRPLAGTFFNDLVVGQMPGFDIRFLGSTAEYTFADPPRTSSFYGGGRDPGVGMATARAYGVLADDVAKSLQPDDPGALKALLVSKAGEIDGFSEGFMTFPLPERKERRPTITDVLEIGYKGIWQERLLINFDAYYTQMKDFSFRRYLTPFAVIPDETLRADLSAAVRSVFTEAELASFGIDVETLASAYAEAGSVALAGLIGIIEFEENYDPATKPELVVSRVNAGSIDYFGIDLSIEAFFNRQWSAFVNGSWVSKHIFDELDLGLPGTSFGRSMNSPKYKVRTGVTYRNGKGFTVSGTLRHNGGFQVFQVETEPPDTIAAYTLFDLSMGYAFSGSATGLTLTITAENLFDHVHREYIGVPKIGRLVTSRLTYSF